MGNFEKAIFFARTLLVICIINIEIINIMQIIIHFEKTKICAQNVPLLRSELRQQYNAIDVFNYIATVLILPDIVLEGTLTVV